MAGNLDEETRKLLERRRDDLGNEIADIEAQTKPLREERERLRAKIDPIEVRIRQLEDEIERLERPHLVDRRNAFSQVHRTLGARQAGEEPPPEAPTAAIEDQQQ
jgi:septal ring factor EnvC (AmiA/AmiB activator)